ncbi:MAG: hypothetical protein LBV15_01315, partial [Planctomycetota bacterium]|nr:hypothetical protein [Planctomycetota bacterium]
MGNRVVFSSLLPLILLSLLAAAGSSDGAGGAAAPERFDDLIESLNAPSYRRASAVEAIYKELRGPNAREMREALQGALSRRNLLIRQGAAEALAAFGSFDDMPALEALLATSGDMEVKCLILRLLPAFCLGDSERARFNFIRYATGGERLPGPNVLPPLRRPPLNRRNRLDTRREYARTQVIYAIVRQFDPVDAALRHIDSRLHSKAAEEAVLHYVGNGLGNDPSRWARLWAAQGGSMDILVPDEVAEIRMSAVLSLSDMGAEGLPEVVGAFRRIIGGGDAVLGQAVFDAMSAMAATAYGDFPLLSDMDTGGLEAAENWRARCLSSASALAVFAADASRGVLESPADESFFASAASCLGRALSFPEGFPDPQGVLAAAKEGGLDCLERLLLMPDIGVGKRTAVIGALGEIGGRRAVSAVGAILASPYASPAGGSDAMRLAEAAVNSLRAAAISGPDGG